MKFICLTFFTLGTCTGLWAQVQTPTLQTTSGGFCQSASMDLSWSLGELAVQTWQGQVIMLTEGFHQPCPAILQEGSSPDLDFTKGIARPGFETTVSPNPFQSDITITFSSPLLQPAMLIVYSLDGKEMYKKPVEKGMESMTIYTGLWTPGLYYLQLLQATDRTTTRMAIVKI